MREVLLPEAHQIVDPALWWHLLSVDQVPAEVRPISEQTAGYVNLRDLGALGVATVLVNHSLPEVFNDIFHCTNEAPNIRTT
jgi:hypothetical protein